MVGPAAVAWVPQALELPEVGADGNTMEHLGTSRGE